MNIERSFQDISDVTVFAPNERLSRGIRYINNILNPLNMAASQSTNASSTYTASSVSSRPFLNFVQKQKNKFREKATAMFSNIMRKISGVGGSNSSSGGGGGVLARRRPGDWSGNGSGLPLALTSGGEGGGGEQYPLNEDSLTSTMEGRSISFSPTPLLSQYQRTPLTKPLNTSSHTP